MNRSLIVTLALAALPLGGCVLGLPNLEVGVKREKTCADYARAVNAAGPEDLTHNQTLALMEACEADRSAGRVTVDPKGARVPLLGSEIL